MTTKTSASATFSRHACNVGAWPLAGKYSIMRGENPLIFAAISACSRYSFKSSEVEEMKTTGSRGIAPPILAENSDAIFRPLPGALSRGPHSHGLRHGLRSFALRAGEAPVAEPRTQESGCLHEIKVRETRTRTWHRPAPQRHTVWPPKRAVASIAIGCCRGAPIASGSVPPASCDSDGGWHRS